MIQYSAELTSPLYSTKSWRFYTEDLSYAFLDIETTGLSPRTQQVILSGLAFEKKNTGNRQGPFSVIQYFAEYAGDEKALLEQTFQELSNHQLWITYNGNGFDLPFLEKRMEKLGIAETLPLHQSFDLYQVIRKFSSLNALLPNLKQKTVEHFLGLSSDRQDEISGKESVALYQQYLRNREQSVRDTILLHNRDDVIQLSRLLSILDKLDLHRILCNLGFWVTLGEKKLLIRKIRPGKNGISVEGAGIGLKLDYENYGQAYEASYDSKSCRFKLWIPAQQLQHNSFIDLECFSIDFSDLTPYNGYESGFLLYKEQDRLAYCEINHLIKLLTRDILRSF